MPNCSQATCEGHGVITVHRRECPRAQPPTCANGFPPVQVADQEGCCPRYQCQCEQGAAGGWGGRGFGGVGGASAEWAGRKWVRP